MRSSLHIMDEEDPTPTQSRERFHIIWCLASTWYLIAIDQCLCSIQEMDRGLVPYPVEHDTLWRPSNQEARMYMAWYIHVESFCRPSRKDGKRASEKAFNPVSMMILLCCKLGCLGWMSSWFSSVRCQGNKTWPTFLLVWYGMVPYH